MNYAKRAIQPQLTFVKYRFIIMYEYVLQRVLFFPSSANAAWAYENDEHYFIFTVPQAHI